MYLLSVVGCGLWLVCVACLMCISDLLLLPISVYICCDRVCSLSVPCLTKSFSLYLLNSTEHTEWERNKEFFTEIVDNVKREVTLLTPADPE